MMRIDAATSRANGISAGARPRGVSARTAGAAALIVALVLPAVAWSAGPASSAPARSAATKPHDPDKPRPILQMDEETHDFGATWEDEPLVHAFTVTNAGTALLVIEKVKPTCGCTEVSGFKAPGRLRPGESLKLTFKLKLRDFAGPYSKDIKVHSNDPVRPMMQLFLKGSVKAYVDFEPKKLFVHPQPGGEPTEHVIKILNRTDEPMKLKLAPKHAKSGSASRPAKGAFLYRLEEDDPGKVWLLRVTVGPPAQWGRTVRERVLIDETNLSKKKTLSYNIEVRVPALVQVLPMRLVWTLKPGVTPAPKAVRIMNNGDKPLELKLVPRQDERFRVKLTEKTPGKLFLATVTPLSPFSGGKTIETITFTTNLEAKKTVSFAAEITKPLPVAVVPKGAVFSFVAGSDPGTRAVALTSQVDKPLTLKLAPPPKEPKFKAELSEIVPNKKFSLTIEPLPPFKGEARYSRSIKLLTNFADQPTITVSASVSVRERLATILRQKTIARDRAATMVHTTILKNNGETPVHLLEATMDDPSIEVSIREKSPGFHYIVEARIPPAYVPPSGGGTLTLFTDDTEKGTIEVKIAMRPIEELVGRPAPAHNFKTIDGRAVSNKAADGTITVLSFVAVDCPFCIRHTPKLASVVAAYAPKGVRFVNVIETLRGRRFTEKAAVAKMAELKAAGELVYDPSNKFGELLRATSYPTTVLLGKTGEVEAVLVGGSDPRAKMRIALEALLAGKPVPALLPEPRPKPAAKPKPIAITK